jgi:thiol-disulfide isomerase/thioredoxin
VFACAALLVGASAVGEAAAEAAASENARPFVVKIHADWCGTCRLLEPTWAELGDRYGEQVQFVLLDVTTASSLETSRAEAERLGLQSFFDRYKSKTGSIGVLDASGEPVEILKGVRDVQDYDAPIQQALRDDER